MAQTLLQVQRQIEQLRLVEVKLKQAEAAGVIGRMKAAIAAYGFTPEDLFDTRTRTTSKVNEFQAASKSPTAKKKSQAKASTGARYADENGNEWVGRGPRPLWLRAEIEAGKSLSDFLIKGRKSKAVASSSGASSSPAATPVAGKGGAKAPVKAKRQQKVTIRFRDDKGNAWSGKGWMPLWMKTAIETSGKTKEDFAV
jgi:DNA-binding protein H-NS